MVTARSNLAGLVQDIGSDRFKKGNCIMSGAVDSVPSGDNASHFTIPATEAGITVVLRRCYRHQVLMVVSCMICGMVSSEAFGDTDLRKAIQKGLHRIEAGATRYPTNRDCFSCHHQAMAVLTLTVAQSHGYEVCAEVIQKQVEFTRQWLGSRIDQMKEGKGLPGRSVTAGYALLCLSRNQSSPDEISDALITFLRVRQKQGHWVASANRPPFENSAFTATALAIDGLQQYSQSVLLAPSRTSADKGLASKMVRQATAWLMTTFPKDNEDRTFRLWGLHAAGLSSDALKIYRDDLLQKQLENGGFAQREGMSADAYATGQALATLAMTGYPVRETSFKLGIRFLLDTQDKSGAWIVTTRSRPVQTFFDNGDPGNKSQFISFVATSWATLALILSEELP